MKQTTAAILTLAAAILAAGAVVGFAAELHNAGAILAALALPTGVVSALALIKACMRDHDMAVDVNARLDFLQELVYLERVSLEHRERPAVSPAPDYDAYSYSSERRKRAAS
jgi:hypothetical protein